jgi:hypothetical protein
VKDNVFIPRFDCVEVVVETPLPNGRTYRTYELAQVLGILSIVDNSNREYPITTFFLFINYLQIHQKLDSDTYFPYCLAGYKFSDTNLFNIDVIEPDMIFRPAMLIACPDRSINLYGPYVEHGTPGQMWSQMASMKKIRFWAIHYVTTDRYGYEDLTDPDDVLVHLAEAEAAEPMRDRHMEELYEMMRVSLGRGGDGDFEDIIAHDAEQDDL